MHVHNSMCQCYCYKSTELVTLTGNQRKISLSLRQCNAHYNNFFHENAFTDLTSQWATLFNSLKVHINKTTCARVLSEKRQLSTLPLPHSKLIIRFFAAIMSSFIRQQRHWSKPNRNISERKSKRRKFKLMPAFLLLFISHWLSSI